MAGLGLFTIASLLCGLAGSQTALVAARALQGLGAAIVSPAVLSIVVTTFTEPAQRARAMGIYGLVSSGGVLLGGILVGTLGWPWIFLVNVPIGSAVLALCRLLLDTDHDGPGHPEAG